MNVSCVNRLEVNLVSVSKYVSLFCMLHAYILTSTDADSYILMNSDGGNCLTGVDSMSRMTMISPVLFDW